MLLIFNSNKVHVSWFVSLMCNGSCQLADELRKDKEQNNYFAFSVISLFVFTQSEMFE